MTICVPIRDLRDTAAFADRMATAEEPVIVTKNGADAFVALSNVQFSELQASQAESRLFARILVAEAERAAGIMTDLHEDVAELRAKYGL